jgi:hypothetical protein
MTSSALAGHALLAADLPQEVLDVVERSITTEYASFTRSGRPVTSPVTPYPGRLGSLVDVSTGLTYPGKAERARRDPRIAMLFSDPLGSGLVEPPVVLVQGLATVRDADLQAGLDRYVEESRRKLPAASKGTPWVLLERQAWYFARIWVGMTPLRVTWWPQGRLDVPPRVWTAPSGTVAPASDPAPAPAPRQDASSTASWRRPSDDWRPAAARAERLGRPVLTVAGADGWPLPVRSVGVNRLPDGYEVELPVGAGVPANSGVPASLTFHQHDDPFRQQENVSLAGEVTTDGERATFTVQRALGDWSLAGGRWARTRAFLSAAPALRDRLQQEAARRGQPVPVVRRPRSR